ncbi:MAG: glycosyltransferase [Vicinamibacteria bacterium]|nr:glycosyltransferase [Vicinamibacteria bacterium]
MRGGEKALEVLCELLPEADLLTLVHVPGRVSPTIASHRIRPSLIQRLPLVDRLYRHYLPLFPFAIEQFDLDDVDLVLSTSHCAAKSVVPRPGARHLCYCFTPMRYAWDQFDHYFGPARVGAPANALARPVLAGLARWDRRTSGRVDRYVAISHYVAGRIRRYYNRPSDVVYPPVDTEFFQPDGRVPEGYLLIVSALVPYKRIDLAIDAAHLAGIPLRIVGDGPERDRLCAQAADAPVEFLGHQTDDQIRNLYRGAAAVVLPGEEDFGIVPVEAQACGRPVVALARGGARETVRDGVTGVLVPEPTAEAFADAFSSLPGRWFDVDVIRRHAEGFSRAQFARQMQDIIEQTAQAPEGTRW